MLPASHKWTLSQEERWSMIIKPSGHIHAGNLQKQIELEDVRTIISRAGPSSVTSQGLEFPTPQLAPIKLFSSWNYDACLFSATSAFNFLNLFLFFEFEHQLIETLFSHRGCLDLPIFVALVRNTKKTCPRSHIPRIHKSPHAHGQRVNSQCVPALGDRTLVSFFVRCLFLWKLW